MERTYGKSIKKWAVISIYFFFVLIIAILCISFSNINYINKNALVLISFGINGIVWIMLMIKELSRHSFSLTLIHWFFFVFFFFVAPVLQYVQDSFPLTSDYTTDSLVFQVNIFLSFYTIFFVLGQNAGRKRVFHNGRNAHKETYLSPYLIVIFTAFSIIFTIQKISLAGLINMFARATASYSFSDNGSANLLIGNLARAVVYISTVLSIHYYHLTSKKMFMIINIVNILISYFPAAIARNAVAGIYVGIMLTIFPMFRKNHTFIFIFLGAFVFAFPILNAFRNASIQDVKFAEYALKTIEGFTNEWLKGDYDAYQMLMLTANYVKHYGMTYGYQLLGVIFFFIPRDIWPNKPFGSGYFIAGELGWSFRNLSSPIPAELIINFGFAGSLIAVLLLGKAVRYLDERYWSYHKSDHELKTINSYDYLYHYLIGHFMFICRGDLMSSIAYVMGVVAVWYVVSKLVKHTKEGAHNDSRIFK